MTPHTIRNAQSTILRPPPTVHPPPPTLRYLVCIICFFGVIVNQSLTFSGESQVLHKIVTVSLGEGMLKFMLGYAGVGLGWCGESQVRKIVTVN